MKIRRIEVRDFRKLRHVLVDDLKDGLNVVVGDNEAGKSTLLAAMRACLFERHRVSGQVAANMQPYGQIVRPEITIDFEIAGRSWRLRKAFCQKPEAELSGTGERQTGDAVEERLAELFGFSPPGKGQSKPDEHQGVHGLLWVEQGRAHQALGVGAGRRTIASALEAEVGQVLGGNRGRDLLEAAERRRDALLYKGGKPRGEFKDLQEHIQGLDEARTKTATALAEQADKVLALTVTVEALERHDRENRLGAAREAHARARADVAANQRLSAAVETAKGILALRLKDKELANALLTARKALTKAVNTAENAVNTSSDDLQDAERLLAGHQKSFETSELARNAAQAGRERADDVADAHRHVLARGRAQAELDRLELQVTAAREADGRRRDHLATSKAITLQDEDVAAVDKLQRELDDVSAQLKAASVKLEFQAEGKRRVHVDGKLHSGADALHVSHDATLELEGFGKLTIHPGGGVAPLRERVQKASRQLADRLRELGYADTQAAREALALRKSENDAADREKRTIAALAPKGLDAMQALVDSQRAIAQRPLSVMAAALKEVTEASLAEAERLAAQAAGHLQAADRDHASARNLRDTALRERDRRAGGAANAQAALNESRANLAAARQTVTDDKLEADQGRLQLSVEDAERDLGTAETATESIDVEIADLELKRAEKAEASIREDIDKLERNKRDLEVELRTLDRDGLGEKLSDLEGKLELERPALARVELEALAAQLLLDTLQQAQRETKDRWLAPVRQRIQPYLRLVQPDSDIVLNEETLEIDTFVRKGVGEPFTGLSVGAREQIAVITRIGLAEMLLASGQPAALVLDDALVNTDEPRLGRMHLVLQKAAENMQVLVLTCRERDFIHLGAPIRRVA
jgi:hypothetical protein